MRKLLPFLLCVAVAALLVACVDDQSDGGSSSGGGQQVNVESPLHQARLDLAERLGIDALEIDLASIRPAGFNGCLGVRDVDEACTEQFIGGFIAMFQVGDDQHRYHFGDDRFVYADPAKQIDDGLDVPAEMAPDLNRQLAAFAREDLTLRLADADGEAVVTAIVPTQFPNGCMGFLPAGMDVCDDALVDGAVVFLIGADDKTYRYHVGRNGVIATDFEDGEITLEPNAAVRVHQQKLREDLAGRLGVSVEEIGVYSYRFVTWPDGCLGVYLPNALCTQALTPGSLAILAGPDGKAYRYHSADDGSFVAASFEKDARIEEPLPEETVE